MGLFLDTGTTSYNRPAHLPRPQLAPPPPRARVPSILGVDTLGPRAREAKPRSRARSGVHAHIPALRELTGRESSLSRIVLLRTNLGIRSFPPHEN